MLIASQKGDIPNAIETGESVIDSFYNANDILKTLCVQEVVQTLLYLKDLYQALGQNYRKLAIDMKFAEIKEQYKEVINPHISRLYQDHNS